MNRYYFTLILFSVIYFGNSQTYEIRYRTSLDEVIQSNFKLNSDTLLTCMHYGEYWSNTYEIKLFKYDISQGTFLDSAFISCSNKEFSFREFSKIFDLGFYQIMVFDCFNPITDTTALAIYHVNNNMQILFDTIVGYRGDLLFFGDAIINSSEQIVLVGMEDSGILLLEERDIFGNLIRKQTYMNGGTLASTIKDIPHKNQYHFYRYWDGSHKFEIINKETLEIESTLEYPFSFLPREVVDGVDSSYYYVAGRYNNITPAVDNLGYLKVNDQGEILESHEYATDTISVYGFDTFCYNEEYIYFGGTHIPTWDPPIEMYPEPRRLILFKLNHNGELIWQKFYNEDVCYYMSNLISTSDGGALIYSSRYDWNDPIPNQRDVSIIKIDSNGNYIPVGREKIIITKQILVYPNPVIDKVYFNFGLYKNLNIDIYNLQGEKVLAKFSLNSTYIDLNSLNSGIYFYTLSNSRGVFEEGKILKN